MHIDMMRKWNFSAQSKTDLQKSVLTISIIKDASFWRRAVETDGNEIKIIVYK